MGSSGPKAKGAGTSGKLRQLSWPWVPAGLVPGTATQFSADICLNFTYSFYSLRQSLTVWPDAYSPPVSACEVLGYRGVPHIPYF